MAPTSKSPELDGYFRPHTSTIDWCELNYDVRKMHPSIIQISSLTLLQVLAEFFQSYRPTLLVK